MDLVTHLVVAYKLQQIAEAALSGPWARGWEGVLGGGGSAVWLPGPAQASWGPGRAERCLSLAPSRSSAPF